MANPPQLDAQDRALGGALLKATPWERWIRRRVESVEWLSATTVQRRVSVDLRLRPEVFGEPVITWGDDTEIVYVPIAQMEKERLVAFDLHDEDGKALPLVTRRRNSCITAAAMSELARSLVFAHVRQRDVARGMRVIDVKVPREVEDRLWRIAHHHPDDQYGGNPYEEFAPPPGAGLRVPSEWGWTYGPIDGWTSNATTQEWQGFLSEDENFARFAFDCFRLYFVCVPLVWQPEARRIVKFGYIEFREEPDPPAVARIKDAAARARVARWWQRVEDVAEGLPRDDRVDWLPAAHHQRGQRSVGLVRRALRALGWCAAACRV